MFEDHISRQVLPVLLLLDLEFIFTASSLLTKGFVQKSSESSTEPHLSSGQELVFRAKIFGPARQFLTGEAR
jgi:hypothetical protein